MEIEPVFQNLPNFRQAGGKSLTTMQGRKVKDGLLFRSSRTDFLTEKEKGVFDELGIRAIIDLRRVKEYKTAGGDKLLDDMYDPCVIQKGKMETYRSKSKKQPDSVDGGYRGRRYLVNMMTMDLIWHVFNQVNFFIRYISLILLLVDWLFGCHLFVRLFNWMIVNRQSLSQQYVDMMECTKPAIADILRLIIDGDNTPVLIHCAHGKDRTGVIIAIILGCLGIDDETISQDYAQSEVSDVIAVGGCIRRKTQYVCQVDMRLYLVWFIRNSKPTIVSSFVYAMCEWYGFVYQAGLAPIRERLYRETVGRYGFRKEFTRADAETMREVLTEIKKRCIVCSCADVWCVLTQLGAI